MNRTKEALQKNVSMLGAMFLLLFISSWPNIQAELAEERWFRDARGLTPFSEVEVTWSIITDKGLLIGGFMKKDRCTFVQGSQVGYVHVDGKPKRSVFVDTSPEEKISGVVGKSRPPSNSLESWGPWLVHWDGPLPLNWDVFVSHKDCPTPPKYQVNMFASGSWADINKVTLE